MAKPDYKSEIDGLVADLDTALQAQKIGEVRIIMSELVHALPENIDLQDRVFGRVAQAMTQTPDFGADVLRATQVNLRNVDALKNLLDTAAGVIEEQGVPVLTKSLIAMTATLDNPALKSEMQIQKDVVDFVRGIMTASLRPIGNDEALPGEMRHALDLQMRIKNLGECDEDTLPLQDRVAWAAGLAESAAASARFVDPADMGLKNEYAMYEVAAANEMVASARTLFRQEPERAINVLADVAAQATESPYTRDRAGETIGELVVQTKHNPGLSHHLLQLVATRAEPGNGLQTVVENGWNRIGLNDLYTAPGKPLAATA